MLSCQLGFELLDTSFFDTFLRAIFTDKCCCSVLEKLLLPDVEYLRLKLILVTQVRHRYMLDQVTSQNGDLLFRGVIVTLLSHGPSSVYDGLSQTGQKSYSR